MLTAVQSKADQGTSSTALSMHAACAPGCCHPALSSQTCYCVDREAWHQAGAHRRGRDLDACTLTLVVLHIPHMEGALTALHFLQQGRWAK